MVVGNDLIVNNRKLIELLDTSQLKPDHKMENSELSKLFFNSLISNINKCCYFDILFINILHSFNIYKKYIISSSCKYQVINKLSAL